VFEGAPVPASNVPDLEHAVPDADASRAEPYKRATDVTEALWPSSGAATPFSP
jgi:hypothetical protein